MKKVFSSWVSLLYVPGDDDIALADACNADVDAIIVDLEDFVPAARKAMARARMSEAVAAIGRAGRSAVVRVNRRLDALVQDLQAAVVDGVDAIMITKASSADHVKLLDEFVLTLERERNLPPGGIRFIPMVETADAVPHIEAIASACTRIVAINVGAEDLAVELAIPADSELLAHIKERMIVAAFASGIAPLGHLGSVKAFGDRESFDAMLRRSLTLGFRGATCIDAAQADAINAIYGPMAARTGRQDARRAG